MEDQDSLLHAIPTERWHRLLDASPKQKVLDASGSVDVDCPGDVSTIILVVEAAVDDRLARMLSRRIDLLQVGTMACVVLACPTLTSSYPGNPVSLAGLR